MFRAGLQVINDILDCPSLLQIDEQNEEHRIERGRLSTSYGFEARLYVSAIPFLWPG